jgi:hypothetical protein
VDGQVLADFGPDVAAIMSLPELWVEILCSSTGQNSDQSRGIRQITTYSELSRTTATANHIGVLV